MKKKLIAVIIFVLLATALLPNFIYALDLEINTQDFQTVQDSFTKEAWDKIKDDAKADIRSDSGKKTKRLQETFSLGSAVASAVVGGLFVIPCTMASSIMTIVTRGASNLLVSGTAGNSWGTGASGSGIINWYTIEDTVFGEIELFDADYFGIDKNDNEINKTLKNQVAIFYYVTKVIAVVMGLIMLIYLGIRMAMSTIASDVAKYKDMLKDWLISMILIFAMPYIIGNINTVARSIDRCIRID